MGVVAVVFEGPEVIVAVVVVVFGGGSVCG